MGTEFNTTLETARINALAHNSEFRLRSETAINDTLKRESVRTLEKVIFAIGEELGFDEEKLANKIKRARRSHYGRVSEMIMIIASMYAWPMVDNSQVSEINELQERVLDTLEANGINIDADLLLDIKEAKGYNTFLSQETFEPVEGVEPEYVELDYYLRTFADIAGLPYIDYKMNEAVYNKLERIALRNIEIEKAKNDEARARYEALNSIA